MTTSQSNNEFESMALAQYIGEELLHYEFAPSVALETHLKSFIKPEHYLAQYALSLYSDAAASVRLLPGGRIEQKHAHDVQMAKKHVEQVSSKQIALARRLPFVTEGENELLIHFYIAPTPEVRKRLGSLAIMGIKQYQSEPISVHFNLPYDAIDPVRAQQVKYDLTDFVAGDLRHIDPELPYINETEVDIIRAGRFVTGASLSEIRSL